MPKDDPQSGTEHPPAPSPEAEAEAILDQLRAELDEAVAARQRALADFANYQRRAAEAERRAAAGGAAAVVRSILGVLDHLDLALGQDAQKVTVEQLRGGVQIARDELLKSLGGHGVRRIDPARGDEFDPHRHEAVMRRPQEDATAGTVAESLQPGYVMGDVVLRPAKVVVAAAPEEGG